MEKSCKDKQSIFFQRAAVNATYSPIKNHRHGCVIVKNGEIISEGYNTYADHMEHKFSIHAEISALYRLGKKVTEGCELYVVRIGTDKMGNPLKYSRPCVDCAKAIIKAGIKKVYYSIDDKQEFGEVKYTKDSIFDYDSESVFSSCSSSSSYNS